MYGFCSQFIEEINSQKENFKLVGLDISGALPDPFKDSGPIAKQVFYSVDQRQTMIIFLKGKEDKFTFFPLKGNVVPTGMFAFTSPELESSISGITLQSGDRKWPIDYSFIFSESVFMKRLKNVKGFARDFVALHWSYFIYNKEGHRGNYIFHLENIRQQMAELFFDESVDELVLDKFIEDNSIILEQGLNLFKPMHQVVLKNVLNMYEHDLKPDLIAFDESDKMWAIVDYKKAKRSIIKNQNKVRTGFKAEVHALEDQLRDYREYFEESVHRDYVKKKYKVEIEYPKAIGIIGNINVSEQTAFNRLVHDKPKWFNVVPYNYLYDNFCRHIDLASKFLDK